MTQLPDLLTRLTVALDGLVRALEAGRPDEVLAAEGPLAVLAAELAACARSTAEIPPGDVPRVRQLLIEARTSMLAASRMGEAAADLARALVGSGEYGPAGRVPEARPAVAPLRGGM